MKSFFKSLFLLLALLLNIHNVYAHQIEFLTKKKIHSISKGDVGVSLYLESSRRDQENKILEEFERAAQIFKSCSITLKIKELVTYKASEEFLNFEAIEFNGGKVTSWEQSFFSKIDTLNPVMLFVEALDWTIKEDGTVAVGYPLYYERLNKNWTKDEKLFFLEKMVGHSVLGQYRSQMTMAHELGHSVFNLSHVNDPQNLMFPIGEARNSQVKLTDSQCQQAKISFSNSRFIQNVL